jgi:hypothetical protein
MNQEIFDSPELQTALRMIAEHCHAKGIHRIDLAPVIHCRQETSFASEPSHLPQRYRDNSIFPVRPFYDQECKAVEHFKKLASRWSAENQFDPPLNPETSSEWHVQHHPECSHRSHASRWCDCGFHVLVKISGRVFAVGVDGALSHYVCPPATLGDLSPNTEYPFLLGGLIPSDIRVDIFFGVPTSFVLAGEGENSRILGKPGTGPIQDFLDAERRRRVSEP